MTALLAAAGILGAWAMLSMFAGERRQRVEQMEMRVALERQQRAREAATAAARAPATGQPAGPSDVVVVSEPQNQ